MESQLVFQHENEIDRLRAQNDLICDCEAPVFEEILSGRSGLAVLDVGCNNGTKTVRTFSSDAVSRVIGLEYNTELAEKARSQYGGERFSFYSVDVEAPDFRERLCALTEEKKIEGFDVIYLSFVLMHLTDADRLLAALRPFLKADGRIVIIESNDCATDLSRDEDGLLGEFLEILRKDRFSGSRNMGAGICQRLSACGYDGIRVWREAILAGEEEWEKKDAIFTIYFSYLPEDIALLLEEEPENEEYKAWSAWLERNFETLKARILREKTAVSMGVKILSCRKGEA